MEKRLLKKIAQDWCKSILLANGMDSFDDDILTQEEQSYIVEECTRIANRITDRPPVFTLPEIVEQYYTLE